MALFSRKKKSNEISSADEQTVELQPLTLEIHTMPKKFLGVTPKLDGKSSGKVEKKDKTKDSMEQPKPASLKRNLFIAAGVIVAVGLIMAGVAYYFSTRSPADDNSNPTEDDTLVEEASDTTEDPEPDPTPDPEPVPDPTPDPEPIPEQVSKPVQLNFNNVDKDSLTLSWIDTSDNEQGFRIYRSSVSGFGSAGVISSVSPNITNYSLVNLNCDTKYYFWIESFKGEQSATGEGGSVTTLSCNPSPDPEPTDLDKDKDLLTEEEEELFGTDPEVADTDFDGYLDGLEVIGLFDPRHDQGAKLSDSTSVRKFVSDDFNYWMLLPISWEEEFGSDTGDQINFVGDSEQFVGIAVSINNGAYSTALEWYQDQFPTISPSELGDVSGQNINGITSPDGLSAYFVSNNYIYTLTYHAGLNQQLEYLTTYRMMVASFSIFEDPFTN